MSTSSNKPRDIKDLKARLGRTGATQPGNAPAPNPPFGTGAAPGASLPPPAVGGGYANNPFPGGASPVPAPPFAQPAGSGRPAPRNQPSGPLAPSSPAPAARGVSPFDVMPMAAPAEKQVRIVIDDSAVKDSEIGRKSLVRNLVLVAVGLGLGAVAGFGVGSTAADRTQYDMAIDDGKQILGKLNEVSGVLQTARTSLKTAADATQGGPGKQAHVDYKAIGELVALPKPFSAGEFSRRRYLAFPTPVVDDLFEYYNNVNLLWSKFEQLGNRTSGQNAREALDKSAQVGDQLVSQDYGVVVSKTDAAFVGGLVVLRPKPADAGDKGKKDEAPVALVSARTGSREVERRMFLGQEDFAANPDHYVIVVDKARSMSLLGAGATLFGQVRSDITESQRLLDKITESEGRLVRELGKVAALKK